MAAPARQSSREPRRRARRRALQAIYQWQMTGQAGREIVAQFLEQQDFAGVDVAWFEQVVLGVTTDHEPLDEALAACLDRPLAQVDGVERAALRLGAYELLRHPEIPVRVVLDEVVDVSRRFGAEQGHGFVNGVLDQVARTHREHEMAARSAPSDDRSR